jgi:hypothetical protein
MHGFVGRQPELATLRARLAAARAGSPQVVLLQGSPGMGKTALLAQFLDEPGGTPPPVVLRAGGEETEDLLAYGVVDQLARSAGPPGAGVVPAGAPIATARDDAVAVGSRLLELLGALGAAAPVVLVIDDAHWVDQPSLKALVFALRRLVADPLLVLFAVREASELPESLRRIIAGPAGSVLQICGLPEQDLRDLGAEWGLGRLSGSAARRLHDGTQGNPLYARAVLEEFPPGAWEPGDRPLPSPPPSAGSCSAATTPAVPTPVVSSTPRRCSDRAARSRSRGPSVRCTTRSRPWTRPSVESCSSRPPDICRGRCPFRTHWCARRCAMRSGRRGARPCMRRPRDWSMTSPCLCDIGSPPPRPGTPLCRTRSPASPRRRPCVSHGPVRLRIWSRRPAWRPTRGRNSDCCSAR